MNLNVETIPQSEDELLKTLPVYSKFSELKEANIVALQSGYDDISIYKIESFPVATKEFLTFLEQKLPDKKIIFYRSGNELSEFLNTIQIDLPNLLVKDIFLPILITLIANYIDRQLADRKKRTSVFTRFRLIVINSGERKLIRISYSGPSDEIPKILENPIIAELIAKKKQ